MTRRKILSIVLITLLSIGLLGFSGCEKTSAERIAQVQTLVTEANKINSSVDTSIGQIEVVIANCEAAINDPNIPDDMKPPVQKTLDAAKEKLSQLKGYKAQLNAAMAGWQAILDSAAAEGEIDLTREIQIWSSLATSASQFVPQPYGGYVYLGGALAAALAGLIGFITDDIRKRRELNSTQGTLSDIVKSAKALLESDQVKDVEEAKFILQDNQKGSTQDAVDAILEPIKTK
jgi:hypothetical protein